MVVDPPHFEGGLSSVIEELDPKSHLSAASSRYPDATLPTVNTAIQPSFFKIGQQGHGGITLERPPMGSFSPNSGIMLLP